MKVSIFGLGYVGCVTAACLAKDGHEVIGVDVVSSKVEKLASGHATVVETGLDELIAEGHRQKRITATTNGRQAVLDTDASIVCVGTPTGPDGSLDLTALRATIEFIGRSIRAKMDRHVVIMRSTVPAGTAESIVLPLLHPSAPPTTLFNDSNLVVVPEFLRESSAIADYYDPPFTLVGSASGKPDGNDEVVQELFGAITGSIQWVPFREAEMLKAVCNGFHALKVAFANEVGALCSAMSIDGHSLMAQFVKDTKLNISPAYMRPGLPFGGSCLPKDLRMLCQVASSHGVDLPLLRGTLASNDAHLKRVIEMVPTTGARRIGLNGLAFKSGTDDLRESPIVSIAEHLIGKGFDVKIHDPGIHESLLTGANKEYIESRIPHLSSRLVATLEELVEHSDILLLTRNGDELVQRVNDSAKRTTIIDLRGQKASKKVRQMRKIAPQPVIESLIQPPPPLPRSLEAGKIGGRNHGNGNGKAKEAIRA
ncbi:MAG TPA: nucleotide sugar dehydrogenase [Methylomirabilota bacterium]|nr:nucleotide sugar dehydrogenase [Methylomirabilota bacterium]